MPGPPTRRLPGPPTRRVAGHRHVRKVHGHRSSMIGPLVDDHPAAVRCRTFPHVTAGGAASQGATMSGTSDGSTGSPPAAPEPGGRAPGAGFRPARKAARAAQALIPRGGPRRSSLWPRPAAPTRPSARPSRCRRCCRSARWSRSSSGYAPVVDGTEPAHGGFSPYGLVAGVLATAAAVLVIRRLTADGRRDRHRSGRPSASRVPGRLTAGAPTRRCPATPLWKGRPGIRLGASRPVRGRACGGDQDAVQALTAGAAALPFACTVNPKLVEAPAARAPL